MSKIKNMTAIEQYELLQEALQKANDVNDLTSQRIAVLLREDIATLYIDERGERTISFTHENGGFTTVWKVDQ